MTLLSLEHFRADALRALRTGRFEATPDGIWMPEAGLRVHGHFEAVVDGGTAIAANMVPLEGITHILGVALGQGAQKAAFYLAPFTAAITAVSTATGANFTANATEFTNYTEPNRVVWAEDGANAGVIGNAASPAIFTIGAGGGTIRGAGLLEAQAKSATTGVLVAYGRFPQDLPMTQGSELRLTYTITGSAT